MSKEQQKVWIFTSVDYEDYWLINPYVFKNKPTLKELWKVINQKEIDDVPYLKDFIHQIPNTKLTKKLLKDLELIEQECLENAEEYYEDNPENGENKYTIEDMEYWFTSVSILGELILSESSRDYEGNRYYLEEIPYIEV